MSATTKPVKPVVDIDGLKRRLKRELKRTVEQVVYDACAQSAMQWEKLEKLYGAEVDETGHAVDPNHQAAYEAYWKLDELLNLDELAWAAGKYLPAAVDAMLLPMEYAWQERARCFPKGEAVGEEQPDA